MGLLGIPTRGKQPRDAVGYRYRNYTNPKAVEYLIRYITRTRYNEGRGGDLVTSGAVGAVNYLSVGDTIRQFLYVQNAYGINSRKGRRMYHEVFNLRSDETNPLENYPGHFWEIGMECCQVYYRMGFQSVFALHWEEGGRYHFHFAVNSINYMDGHKWHTSLNEIKQREGVFNQIVEKHLRMVSGRMSPIYFIHGVCPLSEGGG